MMCIIIYIFTEYFFILKLWYQNLKLDKTYLPKGYFTSVIPGIVSTDHVHCQSKSTSICHGAYAVNTLKVEIETVKGRKISFSHSYHYPHRFLVRWQSPQY